MIIKPVKIYPGRFNMPFDLLFGWRKFVYDSENRVFEIMEDLEMRHCGKLEGFASQKGIRGLSFHPKKELAAFVTEDGMTVSDFYGNRIWDYKAPVSALVFSRDGEELWIAENTNSNKLFISVVDAKSGMENSANTMEDTLYESSLRLCHAPETVLLELAAGQDGIEIRELDATGSAMRHRVVFPKYCHVMPVFHPDGKRCLTLENDEQLFYSYTWPDASLVAKQRDYIDIDREDEEVYPNYSMTYLRNGLAVVQSASMRLYLFDPEKMERLDELVIEGFEPVPIKEVFTNLKDDKSLYSPIERLERFGDMLVAKTGRHAENQALILLSEEDLSGGAFT